ncbi:MAG TPA: hypothetical protein DCP92_10100 [Nitrospiraceae bacterium]|jgi:putative transposase|nr:hypothetical protein [Nitrospiraceae bacterium]
MKSRISITEAAKMLGVTVKTMRRWDRRELSAAGRTQSTLKLSDRVWACRTCGTVHDREVNAVVNLKQLATVETALPVASIPSIGCTDTSSAVSGSKVTPVDHDSVLKKDQGRRKKCALPCTF